MPNAIFCGGLLAEFLNPECWNPLTGETFGRDKTWEMALDPSKWDIPKSREEFQTEWAISRGWTEEGQPYNPKEEMYYYYPDLTNPDFQELFLSWAKKQIDSGVDCIWIDMLYVQPRELKKITGDINHPAVKESYEAASKLIDEIHRYGLTKGRYIYVISWAQPIMFEAPYPQPDLDALMTSIGSKEIRAIKMNEKMWNIGLKKIREKFGDIPIFTRIDYGSEGSPLSVFSQELTIEEANQFLRIVDKFFQQKGVIFIYPVHGGNMGALGGKGVKKLSYGKYDWYDSLAPEFDTYCTIKQLALKKAIGIECGDTVCEKGEDGCSCPQDCCISGDGICKDGCSATAGSSNYDSDCNNPPYISPLIPDLETKEDTVLRYDLTKHENDQEDSNEDLIWQVSEVDEELFEADIQEYQDILTIRPLPNRYGEDKILLTLTDSGGLTAHQRVEIRINPVNDPPVFNPIGDKEIDEAKLLKFKVTAYDVDDDKLYYLVDNLPKGAKFINQLFSWIPDYNQAGKYRVTFTVKDPQGLSDSETITVKVNNVNRAPVARLTANPNQGFVPLKVYFSSRGSYDPDNDTLTYHWNFGDNTYSSYPNPIHIYKRPGRYRVILTVKDTYGAKDSDSTLIKVKGKTK
jgi:hypothetical protein